MVFILHGDDKGNGAGPSACVSFVLIFILLVLGLYLLTWPLSFINRSSHSSVETHTGDPVSLPFAQSGGGHFQGTQ